MFRSSSPHNFFVVGVFCLCFFRQLLIFLVLPGSFYKSLCNKTGYISSKPRCHLQLVHSSIILQWDILTTFLSLTRTMLTKYGVSRDLAADCLTEWLTPFLRLKLLVLLLRPVRRSRSRPRSRKQRRRSSSSTSRLSALEGGVLFAPIYWKVVGWKERVMSVGSSLVQSCSSYLCIEAHVSNFTR